MQFYEKACIAFDMFYQLLAPLEMIHKANFVHGDIKPDNICVRKREVPVSLSEDFKLNNATNLTEKAY